MAGMFFTRRSVGERSKRCSRAWRRVSGLLSEISPPVGRFGDGDLGGGATSRRWVAGVVLPAM